MTPTNTKATGGLQWWIMSAMWAVMLAGGAGLAANWNTRLAALEQFVKERMPEARRTAIVDHESRMHRDTVTGREVSVMVGGLEKRLDRIETKIDELRGEQ